MEKWKQASFTVEAAMIMSVVLLVIFAVINGSSTVYKRAIDTAKEYEETLLEKEYDPSPVTYARRIQAMKDLILEE